jgi:hypothetical protein
MSAEYKPLVTIKTVIDHDCGNYSIGEIDGLFQEHELEQHIRLHGATEIFEHLAFLTHQVIEARNKVNEQRAWPENQTATEG